MNEVLAAFAAQCFLLSAATLICVSYRGVLQQADLEKQHLERTVKSLRERCSSLEHQCVQHGHVQQKMRTRYVRELYWPS